MTNLFTELFRFLAVIVAVTSVPAVFLDWSGPKRNPVYPLIFTAVAAVMWTLSNTIRVGDLAPWLYCISTGMWLGCWSSDGLKSHRRKRKS